MADLKICRICLRTECAMYNLDRFQLISYYEEVMALKVDKDDKDKEEDLPHYVCYECATILHKFHQFKHKCYMGQKTLRELMRKGPLSYGLVYEVDRNENKLRSSLEVMSASKRVKFYKILSDRDSDNGRVTEKIQKEAKIDTKYVGGDINDDKTIDSDIDPMDNNKLEIKITNVRSEKESKFWSERDVMKLSSVTKRRTRFLNGNHWNKYSLSEDEALKEFRARTEDVKFVNAPFKCTECYKGFSKEEMLERHLLLRHDKSLGPHECRFCHMRFKIDSHLRTHTQQHITRYQCTRCRFICPLENSAFLHEEYHNGVKRKCFECGAEFRHASSYYSHLRNYHRSKHVHVCNVCGESFVTETGLHHHKKVKHVHSDVIKGELKRGKAFDQDDVTPVHTTKRKSTRPTTRRKHVTCHQCGQHFETLAACMEHRGAAHPRTSSCSDNRHICEICGASLAPGSVANHENMHSKKKLSTCDTCGKLFHSNVDLKRHLITHTDEKAYVCSLCSKRFKQRCSMKLHYRTFHLLQPYPKRNRRKQRSPAASPSPPSSPAA